MLKVYIGGTCKVTKLKKIASCAVIVQREQVGHGLKPYHKERIWESCKIIGSGDRMSSGVARYNGLVTFLEWFDTQPVDNVIIYSDSQMLINQMNNNWEAKKGLYVAYYKRAMSLLINNAEVWKGKIRFVSIYVNTLSTLAIDKLPGEINKLSREIIQYREELENTILDLTGKLELSESKIKQLLEAQSELKRIEGN